VSLQKAQYYSAAWKISPRGSTSLRQERNEEEGGIAVGERNGKSWREFLEGPSWNEGGYSAVWVCFGLGVTEK